MSLDRRQTKMMYTVILLMEEVKDKRQRCGDLDWLFAIALNQNLLLPTEFSCTITCILLGLSDKFVTNIEVLFPKTALRGVAVCFRLSLYGCFTEPNYNNVFSCGAKALCNRHTLVDSSRLAESIINIFSCRLYPRLKVYASTSAIFLVQILIKIVSWTRSQKTLWSSWPPVSICVAQQVYVEQ